VPERGHEAVGGLAGQNRGTCSGAGLGHLAWAGGIAVLGATPEQFEKTGQGSASHLATETAIGSVAMAGGLLALALVQPWGSALPRWLLRAAAWAGAAVAAPAAAYGIIGVVQQTLAAAGRYQFPAGHAATAPGWWFFWYALFAAAGSTLTATVWLTRRSRTPHPPGPVRKRRGGVGNPPGTPPPTARPSSHPRPTSRSTPAWRRATRMAYLGSLAALGYGALKATWALGGTLGLQDPAQFHATEHGFSGGQRFAACWGTVILAGLAAAILLALVRPWATRCRTGSCDRWPGKGR
jgi:hypothetical protein